MFFYCDAITRRVAATKATEVPSPWGKTDPAGHQTSMSMSLRFSMPIDFYIFYLVMIRPMITKNLVMKIQNLIVNRESQSIKLNLKLNIFEKTYHLEPPEAVY